MDFKKHFRWLKRIRPAIVHVNGESRKNRRGKKWNLDSLKENVKIGIGFKFKF